MDAQRIHAVRDSRSNTTGAPPEINGRSHPRDPRDGSSDAPNSAALCSGVYPLSSGAAAGKEVPQDRDNVGGLVPLGLGGDEDRRLD